MHRIFIKSIKIPSFLITRTQAQVRAQSHACNLMLVPLGVHKIDQRQPCRNSGNVETIPTGTYLDNSISLDSETSVMPKRKLKKHMNHPKKVQKFAHEEQFKDVEYFYENGLRKIKPYVYKFETHAKGRWFGRKLLEVFKKEFRLESAEYYAKAIQGGLIKVNKKQASPDRILKNNDFMQSKVHRHEPPVSGERIQIIADTEEYLVINKPASIPVHPCGKYRHNTIVFILGREYGLQGLHTIHRLDRLTSGLLMFARSLEVSHRVDAYVRDRHLQKTYLCMVKGEFPSEPVECNQPIFIVSHKIGVCRVKDDGKDCKTRFECLSYDGETSIVKCYPYTGRMHQIRVHLQYLGFPIANDPLYNNDVWGPQRGKGGCNQMTDDELLKDLITQHDMEIDLALERGRQQQKMAKDGKDFPTSDTVESTQGQFMKKDSDTLSVTQSGDGDVIHGSICASNSKDDTTSMQITHHNGDDKSDTVTTSSHLTQRTSQEQVLTESKERSESQNFSVREEDVIGDSIQCESKGACHVPQNVTEVNTVLDGELCDATVRSDNDIICHNEDATSVQLQHDGDNNEIESQSVITSQLTESELQGNTTSGTAESGKGTAENDGSVKSEVIGRREEEEMEREKLEEKRTDQLAMSLCRECNEPMPDPEPQEMCIYLHALSYKGPDFEFTTPIPVWAKEHFKRTGVEYE